MWRPRSKSAAHCRQRSKYRDRTGQSDEAKWSWQKPLWMKQAIDLFLSKSRYIRGWLAENDLAVRLPGSKSSAPSAQLTRSLRYRDLRIRADSCTRATVFRLNRIERQLFSKRSLLRNKQPLRSYCRRDHGRTHHNSWHHIQVEGHARHRHGRHLLDGFVHPPANSGVPLDQPRTFVYSAAMRPSCPRSARRGSL